LMAPAARVMTAPMVRHEQRSIRLAADATFPPHPRLRAAQGEGVAGAVSSPRNSGEDDTSTPSPPSILRLQEPENLGNETACPRHDPLLAPPPAGEPEKATAPRPSRSRGCSTTAASRESAGADGLLELVLVHV
jgi:hypothetical protein